MATVFLYASILPLWEGFDEPFHYAYVQSLWTAARWPVVGESKLSDEIWQSMTEAPASHVVVANVPGLRTYSEYFRLPPGERAALHDRTSSISPELRNHHENGHLNYEAHQAPLAYLLLAPFDRMLSNVALPDRIFRLRLIAGSLSILLLWIGTMRLMRELGLEPEMQCLVLLLVFDTQMLYASTVHICNDWLAIPLTLLFLGETLRYLRTAACTGAVRMGLLLAAALLSKSYAVALIPAGIAGILSKGSARDKRVSLAIFVGTPFVIAGPWYVRNAMLYGTPMAMQEQAGGIGVRQVISAAAHIDWPAALGFMTRGAIWTGNNLFTTFSHNALNFFLAAIAIGALQFLWTSKRTAQDVLLAAFTAVFALAVLYAAAQSFAYTKGASVGASPWYLQPLLVPVLCESVVGMSRSGRVGRAAGLAAAAMATYIGMATYVCKLIPTYAGMNTGRSTLLNVIEWWTADRERMMMNLRSVILIDPPKVIELTILVTLLQGVLFVPVACFLIAGLGKKG